MQFYALDWSLFVVFVVYFVVFYQSYVFTAHFCPEQGRLWRLVQKGLGTEVPECWMVCVFLIWMYNQIWMGYRSLYHVVFLWKSPMWPWNDCPHRPHNVKTHVPDSCIIVLWRHCSVIGQNHGCIIRTGKGMSKNKKKTCDWFWLIKQWCRKTI